MKYVLFYEPSADAGAKAGLHFAEHQAMWADYQQAGTLLLVGPFADGTGAMAVFTTREAAEEFAKEDPFVAHGVVSAWSVRQWNEAIFNP
jgi:uncharacterized protein YciI